MIVNEYMRSRRRASNLSMEDLAGLMGKTRQYIYLYETGKKRMTAEIADEIAQHLKCDMMKLMRADYAVQIAKINNINDGNDFLL